jgi:hypothetical protein
MDENQPGIDTEQPNSTENAGEQSESSGEEITSFTLPEPDTSAYDIMLKKIDKTMLETSDPKKFNELLDTRRKVKRQQAQEISAARAREWRRKHPDEWRNARYPDQIIERDGTVLTREGVPDQEIDRIAQDVGVTKEGGLDPEKLLGIIKAQYQKNPTLIKMLGKAMGVDKILESAGIQGGIEAGINAFEQVVKNGKSDEIAGMIGTGVASALKEKVTPWIQNAARPQQSTAMVPGAGQKFVNPQGFEYTMVNGVAMTTDGRRLWNRNGQWIDPTHAYIPGP